ncbi:MAG: hypothetical protein ABIL68_16350 [bacterium]
MSKVLIFGHALPTFSSERTEAYGYRTLQLLKPILNSTHDVTVLGKTKVQKHLQEQKVDSFSYFEWGLWEYRKISRLVDSCSPDCIVAVGLYNSIISTFFVNQYPTWMDIYGDPITESQLAQVFSDKSLDKLSVRKFLHYVLKFGDKFSVLSTPQKYCMIGELAIAGRLNGLNLGYDLVDIVFPGVEAKPMKTTDSVATDRSKDDTFRVVWSGGYNVWCDTKTLFEGLNKAMTIDPRIEFVSTGGPAVSSLKHDELLRMIDSSENKDRFHMLGYQKSVEDVYKIWGNCDVGIVTDIHCYETEIGSRTRIFEKLNYHLPVIMSEGSELSQFVEKFNVGRTFKNGNADLLCDIVLELSQNGDRLRIFKKNIKSFLEYFSFANTTKSLNEWVKNPCKAPDRSAKIKRASCVDFLKYFYSYLRLHLLKRMK